MPTCFSLRAARRPTKLCSTCCLLLMRAWSPRPRGHVACHEAGAIEFGGHKVLTVPGHEGRMHADELEQLIDLFYADDNHEHMVFPGAAYISFPTELGTLYSRDELAAIYEVCQKHVDSAFCGWRALGLCPGIPRMRYHSAAACPAVRCLLYRRKPSGGIMRRGGSVPLG